MTILNKVQYFQNKCGCNKTLVYLYQKNKKNHPNCDDIKTKYNRKIQNLHYRKIVEKKIQDLQTCT